MTTEDTEALVIHKTTLTVFGLHEGVRHSGQGRGF